MRYIIDHDYHIHSMLSSCSNDPKQTTEAILQYAMDNHFTKICLTDHYWDSAVEGASNWYAPQNYDHLAQALPLPQSENCKFVFGCETDMDRFLKIGVPKERYDDFDFMIIPTTHLHMDGFTFFPEEGETVAQRAALYLKRLDALLDMDLPFHKVGLAHMTCSLLMHKDQQYLQVLDTIADEEYAVRFKRMAELGCGIELNMALSELQDESILASLLRPYRIAKSQGCKFYLGSDAHHPEALANAMERFEKIVDLLELTEDDKFHF